MLVCEAPVMIQGIYSVLDAVSKWVLRNNVREVLVLDGIAVEGLPSSRTPIIVSSDGREADAANLIHDYNGDVTKKEEANVVDNAGSIYPTTAFVGGMAGGVLSSSNSIPSKAIRIYAARGIPDPEGAAILIESLGKITDNTSLKIDTSELRKQGAALKTRMEKIIQSLAEQQQQGQQEQAQGSTSVRDGVMYG